MDWIKKHYDQFLLVLAAVALLAVAILLILRVNGFNERFAAAQEPPMPKKNVPPLVLEPIDLAKQALETPATWKPKPEAAFFLVPQRYIIDPATKKPVKLAKGTAIDSLTGKPIPYQWFIDHNLDPLNANVTQDDTDKDGFANEDEWRADSDPQKADSHPSYATKLYFKQWVKTEFIFLFKSVTDGDPDKDKKEKLTFGINPSGRGGKTQFKKIGELVDQTSYKVVDFSSKKVKNEATGIDQDLQVLSVQDTVTGDTLELPKDKLVPSPQSIAVFDYVWPQPPKTVQFKTNQQFALEPDAATKYKLVDIKQDEAVITTPSGENLTIQRDPRGKR